MAIFHFLLVGFAILVNGLVTVSAVAEPIESAVKTRSGLIERIRIGQDERQFAVRLTRPDHSVVWLEEPAQKFSLFRTFRQPLNTADGSVEGVFEMSGRNPVKLLGVAPRVFEKDCSAMAQIETPTPLGHARFFSFDHLQCDDTDHPLTQNKNFLVLGKEDKNWVRCAENLEICEWTHRYPIETEAASQVAVFSFLSFIKSAFSFSGVEINQPLIRARSTAFRSNRSIYDAENRTLSYGSGQFPDALDGFVVIHEWMHSVVDDLNRGMYGYEASVLHEALADYLPAQLFNSSCFAPFDAQELPERKCLRELYNTLTYPKDMRGNDAHFDSQIFSGALWEFKKQVPSEIILEVITEALMRLPKDTNLLLAAQKIEASYARLVEERPLMEDHRVAVREIFKMRGL